MSAYSISRAEGADPHTPDIAISDHKGLRCDVLVRLGAEPKRAWTALRPVPRHSPCSVLGSMGRPRTSAAVSSPDVSSPDGFIVSYTVQLYLARYSNTVVT